MICKSFKDKEKLRRAGRSAATILDRLCSAIQPGMSTLEIDELGGQLMKNLESRVLVKDTVPGTVFFLPTLVLSKR